MSGVGPRRVLIVSADIGGGHHATGRALEAAVREHWPAAAVEWVDTLEVMHAGPAFRWIYRANVERTPWLYDFFYDRIRRHRWFARSSKEVTSVWAGSCLARVLDRLRPDLVLSTYPLGSGGLAWLRRRGRLDVPVGAWVSDFAPHPFWIYGDLDLHVVMHASCVDLARRAEPSARVVGPAALPVVSTFADGDRVAARRSLGLPLDRFTALVSCGVYGFGAVEEAVEVLLAAGGGRVQVVVATGRNAALHGRLIAGPAAGDRLTVLGWTDRMPELTRAADVVVTNAGGATALESLASRRPVLMFRPIAGHGMANARSMAAAGVAVLCRNGAELATEVGRLLDDPAHLRRLDAATGACTSGGSLADDLDRLLAARAAGAPRTTLPLSAEDAFWAHLDGPRVPQRVAALAVLRPTDAPVTAEAVHHAMAATLPAHPWLTWCLDDRPGRRPRWRTDGPDGAASGTGPSGTGPSGTGPSGTGPSGSALSGSALPGSALPVSALHLDGRASDVPALFDEFVARPLTPGQPPWEIQVAGDWPGGRAALLIRAHHAFGDGLGVLDAFTAMATRRPVHECAPAPALAPVPPAPGGRTSRPTVAAAAGSAGAVMRGLLSLARAGAAPATPLSGRRSGDLPARHAFLTLPGGAARAAARSAGVGTSDLMVGMVAEAVHCFLRERGTPAPSGTVRAMVPRVLREGGGRGPGNHTTAVRIDLPVGPMPPAGRPAAVRNAVAAALAQDQPAGARAVLALAARLPPRLHAAAARALYRSTWFDLIVSVIPGPRTARWLGTARIEEAYAVLPLAEGVGLAVGVLAWDDVLAVALTWDPVLLPDGDRLAAAIRPAFRACGGTP